MPEQPTENLIGAHCFTGGDLTQVFVEAENLQINTLQIFTRNPLQWNNAHIPYDQILAFKNRWKAMPQVKIILSHAKYLINLASSKKDIYRKSIEALIGECERCEQLGLHGCVFHPGSSSDPREGIKRIVEAIKAVLQSTSNVLLLLENTAGSGNMLCADFVHIRAIMEMVGDPRVGICLDTCHAFAAGYDFRTRTAWEDFIDYLDRMVGIYNIKALHLNDSKYDIGTRKDRHHHIGLGRIGKESFSFFVQAFPHIPKLIETPKEGDWDNKNIAVLRSFIHPS